MMRDVAFIDRFRGDRRGVAALEFALVCPILIFLMIGMIVWGGWFWLAHSVQSLASEAARASVAGLDLAERETLARAAVARHIEGTGVAPEQMTVDVQSDGDLIRIAVAYDAADHPVLVLADLVPAPPRVIERTASIRTGGY